MLLWIGFALLAALVTVAVTSPLLRPRAEGSDTADADIAVYRDQIAEIDAEKERGLIAPAEAASARTEVARRLLQRADEAKSTAQSTAAQARGERNIVFYLSAAFLPVASLAIYLALGSPQMPDNPLAARLNAPIDKANIDDLLAKVETVLRTNPNDGQGWDVVAPIYMRIGRYADAAEAFRQAGRLLGETPKRLSGYAESTILANDGIVNDAARSAYQRLLAAEPDRPDAKFWLAMAKEQNSDLAGAAADYRKLVETLPADAPARKAAEMRLKVVDARLSGKEPPAAAPGQPSDDQIAKMKAMSPAEREAAITKMVEGLATRLKADGKDLEGWFRLARAYKVLGRNNDAVAAIANARKNFQSDTNALAQIDAVAKSLGIGS
jgi:cytochrome c-type biogenesis protein CcmH